MGLSKGNKVNADGTALQFESVLSINRVRSGALVGSRQPSARDCFIIN